MYFLIPPKQALGEDTVTAEDIINFKPGTFYISYPDISFSAMEIGDLSTTALTIRPSLGFFVSKYISISGAFSVSYSKADYQGESASTNFLGFFGAMNGFLPAGQRAYFHVGAGLGYYGVSSSDNYSDSGNSDTNGANLGFLFGMGYFVNRFFAIEPFFEYDHIFESPSITEYSVGLGSRLFFPSGK